MALDELDEDQDLAEEEEQERRRSFRNRSLGAVAALVVAGAAALGLAARSCAGGKKDADRLTLRSAAAKFEASPADEAMAQALASEYEARGKRAEADQVRRRHAAAVAASAGAKEKALRARLAAAQDDEQAMGQLVELLARRKDLAGAKAEYAAFVQRNPSAKRRASFGAWLWRNGFAQDAVPELAASLKEADDPYARAHLGLALFDLGKKRQARDEILRAQEAGADMDVLNERILAIEEELGAESAPAPNAKPAKRKPPAKSGARR